MLRDDTIDIILEKIKRRYKKETGKDISTDDLFKMVNSQFELLPKAVKEQDVLKLDKFGKFRIKKGKAEFINKQTEDNDKP